MSLKQVCHTIHGLYARESWSVLTETGNRDMGAGARSLRQ